MKRKIILGGCVLAVVFVLVVIMFSVSRQTVDAGYEGVLVDKPYLFGKGGIRPRTLKTGAEWLWRSTQVVRVEMRPFQMNEKFDDMISSDNIPVDFAAYMKIVIVDPIEVIGKFGETFYAHNIREVFRTAVRNQCKRYSMTELISDPAASAGMENDVLDDMKKLVVSIGLPVTIQDIVIGKINPNSEVLAAINLTAAQQQAQKTEYERAKAETSRKQAEENRAVADKAYMEKMGLDQKLFVELERIKATTTQIKELAEKGKDVVFVINPGSAVLPLPR